MTDRMADLQDALNSTYEEVAGWIDDLRTYFPKAEGMHDVYRGIEALQEKIAKFEAREKWMKERVYYAEWFDDQGRTAHHQAEEDGFYDHEKHGEYYGFTELINQVMK